MLVIRAGRAFDGERVVADGVAVVVDGARIAAVEPVGAGFPADWTVHDFPAATVLPGLPDHTDAQVDEAIGAGLARHLSAGVTTVRDLGDRRWAVLPWRGRPDVPT